MESLLSVSRVTCLGSVSRSLHPEIQSRTNQPLRQFLPHSCSVRVGSRKVTASHLIPSDQCNAAVPSTHERAEDIDQRSGATPGPVSEESSSFAPSHLFSSAALVIPALAEGTGYSQASYYTSLGLFILSVPGVWSLIKRSTKSKLVKKTFVIAGPKAPEAKALSVVAGEITSFFTRSNYQIADRGEVVTFEGIITPSRSQAAFLVFCTLLSLASVALVLTITWPEGGQNWYWITVISPLSGYYYWTKASRTEQIKVKMVIADDEQTADVVIQGDQEEVERCRKEVGLMEKGMVYVKGLLE